MRWPCCYGESADHQKQVTRTVLATLSSPEFLSVPVIPSSPVAASLVWRWRWIPSSPVAASLVWRCWSQLAQVLALCGLGFQLGQGRSWTHDEQWWCLDVVAWSRSLWRRCCIGHFHEKISWRCWRRISMFDENSRILSMVDASCKRDGFWYLGKLSRHKPGLDKSVLKTIWARTHMACTKRS